jgi:hypothetical protein
LGDPLQECCLPCCFSGIQWVVFLLL